MSRNATKKRINPLRILDLFCGQGGAGMGYHRAGFDVVGVDWKPQPRYPFTFHQGDAFEFLERHWMDFDAIHASPPCQAYSYATPEKCRIRHKMSIAPLRLLLESLCPVTDSTRWRPWVIENVVGARATMNNPTMLCGSMFGLKCYRHRLFETNEWGETSLPTPPSCNHNYIPLLVTTASASSRALRRSKGMAYKTVKNAPSAYGIDWMTCEGLKEAIPPAYTEWIGERLKSFMERN
jgi:DNA (cytosine-5)-methyltransferase 1